MTLLELINELQKMRVRVNDQIEVEVCVFEDSKEPLFEKIKSVEETEKQNGQGIVAITLKDWY